jgi:hypothetical protein
MEVSDKYHIIFQSTNAKLFVMLNQSLLQNILTSIQTWLACILSRLSTLVEKTKCSYYKTSKGSVGSRLEFFLA